MKSKKILVLMFVGIVALTAAVSCQKSRYCLCVSTETPVNDTMIVNLDRSMSCDRIMQLGIQKQDAGILKIDSIHTYTCAKIKKDSLDNYNNLPRMK